MKDTIKFARLEKLHSTMLWTARHITRLSGVFKDDETRERFCNEICYNVLREYLVDYHNGSFFTIKQPLAEAFKLNANDLTRRELRELCTFLEVIYDIARIHFNIFEDLEYNEFDECDGYNFVNYIMFLNSYPDFISGLKEYTKEHEDDYKAPDYKQLIKDIDKSVEKYDHSFNYPSEDESVEDYIKRAK